MRVYSLKNSKHIPLTGGKCCSGSGLILSKDLGKFAPVSLGAGMVGTSKYSSKGSGRVGADLMTKLSKLSLDKSKTKYINL